MSAKLNPWLAYAGAFPVSTGTEPTIQDATELILRFYNRARDLGWTTPEMDDARQYLRRVAPQEVW